MKRYCYICPTCGRTYEKEIPDFVGTCENTHHMDHDTLLRRDWKAEGMATKLLPNRYVDTL